jgi:REP element-mobilizing transposase RayT
MDQEGLPQRRSIRLRDFDYTRNHAYFVTLCSAERRCLFGHASEGEVVLSAIGQIVASAWQEIPQLTPGLKIDSWVVMPNHVHGIVILPGADGRSPTPSQSGPRSGSLGAVIGGFKSAVSREARRRLHVGDAPIWRRNYFERIARSDREFEAMRDYIANNPARRDEDPDHPRRWMEAKSPPRR